MSQGNSEMRMYIFVFFLLLCFLLSYSYAQSPGDIKKQLIKKGFPENVVSSLNIRCQRSLNEGIPEEVTWYATYNQDAKSVTVDFQKADKTHNSISFFSLKDGGCMVVQNSILMTNGPCKPEAERWINSFKKHKVDLKFVEQSEQRIYLGSDGMPGLKIYLYPMGNLCMQVFRNAETLKK